MGKDSLPHINHLFLTLSGTNFLIDVIRNVVCRLTLTPVTSTGHLVLSTSMDGAYNLNTYLLVDLREI